VQNPDNDARFLLPTPKGDRLPTDDNGKIIDSVHDNTWVCICRPRIGMFRWHQRKEPYVEMEHRCRQAGICFCGRPASANPEHKRVVTKRGYRLTMEWFEQYKLRNQEDSDMLIFRKWTGYGICEVIENMVSYVTCIGVWSDFEVPRLC